MRESYNYKQLFKYLPSPMYVYNCENFHFLAVNEAALVQYGYTEEEFLQLTAENIRPQEELEAFYAATKAVPANYFDAGRWRHVDKNGNIFYIRAFTHRIIFAGQQAIIVLADNIHKKVTTENALAEKIKETEIILDSITDGFFSLNKNWEFTYVNKECARIFQHTVEELLGKNAWELFPEGKKLKFYAEYNRVIEKQESAHFEEYDSVYKKWVAVNAYPTKEGIAVYFVDITERKNIEEQIYLEKENLHAIINNTRDIIWSIDSEAKLISANNAFWERVAKMVGKPVYGINENDYAPGLYATWQQYFKRALTGEYFQIIWEDTNHGEASFEEVSFNPIRNREGKVVGVSCFSRNITAQMKYEQKIEKQNEQLREIAFIQSHGVRKHVANLLGITGLIDFSACAGTENEKLLEMIMQSTKELDKLIHEVVNRTFSLD